MRPNYSPGLSTQASSALSPSVEALAAGYCLISIWLAIVSPYFKLLPYGIPLVSIMAVLASGRPTLPPNAIPYLIVIGAAILMAPFASFKGLQDVWLILTGLAPYCFGYKYRLSWRFVFGATVLATVASFAINSVGGRTPAFDLLTSQSPFESSTSFVFGILVVWAAVQRRWFEAFLALLFAFLTLKRVVVLAGSLTIIVMLLPRGFVDRLLRPLPMLVVNAIMISTVIAYTQGAFDNYIENTFGQSSNQFGMGRQALYYGIVQLIVSDPWQFLLYGIGPGGIYSFLALKGQAAYTLLHNDSLKLLGEYGAAVWTLFFWFLYADKRFEVRVTMLFMNVLLLTDNTLIYPFVISSLSLALLRVTESQSEISIGKLVRN